MSPEVLYRVIYGTTSPDTWQKDRLSIQPGLLYGYQRHRVKYADYPAIYPLNGDNNTPNLRSRGVLGVIVKGLSDMDVLRLDIFEGDQYDRKQVEAYPLKHSSDSLNHVPSSGSSIRVETYIWKPKHFFELDPAEWDFEEFRREKLRYWAGPEVMRDDYAGQFAQRKSKAGALILTVVDAAVAGQAVQDSTGGRGAHGSISRQLADLQKENDPEEPLKSAV